MRRARSGTGVSAQAGQASCAATAARSTSDALESGTRASVSPVAGSRTSSVSLAWAAVVRPPIRFSSSSGLGGACAMPSSVVALAEKQRLQRPVGRACREVVLEERVARLVEVVALDRELLVPVHPLDVRVAGAHERDR